MKQKILIFYDHFYPAWKAGGPIQSISNLIFNLQENYKFYVVCSAYEYGENKILPNITPNKWINWNYNTQVLYKSKRFNLITFRNLINEISPDFIFIKGLYSFKFTVLPLFYQYISNNLSNKTIISPIGMLHPGALSQKKFKKKIFINLIKYLGIHKKIQWHATDLDEFYYIKNVFGEVEIKISSNFPKILNLSTSPYKTEGSLIMGTIALISPMKNHLEILKALAQVKDAIVWHIYGPIKDSTYWKSCNDYISQLPKNIKIYYHGSLEPKDVYSALSQIQLFILPSKSENYGHAILEALSAGKPVISTNTTPFIDLHDNKAGITISVDNIIEELKNSIEYFSKMNENVLKIYQNAARDYALNKVNVDTIKNQYHILFSNKQIY